MLSNLIRILRQRLELRRYDDFSYASVVRQVYGAGLLRLGLMPAQDRHTDTQIKRVPRRQPSHCASPHG